MSTVNEQQAMPVPPMVSVMMIVVVVIVGGDDDVGVKIVRLGIK